MGRWALALGVGAVLAHFLPALGSLFSAVAAVGALGLGGYGLFHCEKGEGLVSSAVGTVLGAVAVFLILMGRVSAW